MLALLKLGRNFYACTKKCPPHPTIVLTLPCENVTSHFILL